MDNITPINALIKCVDSNLISDGYHTFGELYEHRNTLFAALLKTNYELRQFAWRSKKHSDGSEMEGWFILGLFVEPGAQLSYHMPIKMWDQCEGIRIEELAPVFDGHTSADVLERLNKMRL